MHLSHGVGLCPETDPNAKQDVKRRRYFFIGTAQSAGDLIAITKIKDSEIRLGVFSGRGDSIPSLVGPGVFLLEFEGDVDFVVGVPLDAPNAKCCHRGLIQNFFTARLGDDDVARFAGGGVEVDQANAVALETVVARGSRIFRPGLSPQAGQNFGVGFRVEVGLLAAGG